MHAGTYARDDDATRLVAAVDMKGASGSLRVSVAEGGVATFSCSAAASVKSVSSGRQLKRTFRKWPRPRLMYRVRPGPTSKVPAVYSLFRTGRMGGGRKG